MSSSYVKSIESLLLRQTETNLKEVAVQGSVITEQALLGKLELLRTVVSTLTNFDSKAISEQKQQLKSICDRNDLSRIGYANLSGDVITSDNQEFNISNRDYFKRALAGEEVISDVIDDKSGVFEQIIVVAVPVIENDNVTAVLFGVYDTDHLTSILDISFFNNLGYAYLCSNNGDVISNPKEEQKNLNLYTVLSDENSPEQVSLLKEQLSLNQTGTIRYKLHQQDIFIGYAPLEGISLPWNIMAILPSDIVFQQSTEIVFYTILSIIVIFLLLVGIVTYVFFAHSRNEKRVLKAAYTDDLCGIYNYIGFCTNCDKLLLSRVSQQYAIIYLDVDNFKILNNAYGIEYGNKILKNISLCIKDVFSDNISARFSSDFFTIFCPYTDKDEIIQKVKNLIWEIHASSSHRCDVTVSIGLSFSNNSKSANIEVLISEANMARKTIKGLADPQYAIYDNKMSDKLREDALLLEEVKIAIANKDFQVYYQPKFNILDSSISGSEALIRWKHPQRGFIPPMSFIPIAEKAELITEIDRFVFEVVCSNLRTWIDAGINVLPISINVSRAELYRKDITDFYSKMLEKYDIDPKLIEVEITETMAASDMDNVKKILNDIKKLDLAISIDDFGSGYSSLGCLEDLPVDLIKLDRSFLTNIEGSEKSKSIIKGIILLSKELNLKVVCEGIETQEQLDLLKGFDCDYAQGFFFAKPMPSEDFLKLLDNNDK